MSRWNFATPKERFESHVLKQPNSCWEWQGYLDKDGRGRFSVGKRMVTAPRVAWELYRGKIPHGMFVLHTCDNPRCVNVDHLYLGSHQDNMRDTLVRRTRRYARHKGGKQRLDWSKVATIRRAECTPENQRVLCNDLGISVRTIRRVWRQDPIGGWPESERPADYWDKCF